MHRDLGPIEDTRFVHIVPDVQILGGMFVLIVLELVGPPLTRGRIGVVDPRGRSGPAPTVIVRTLRSLDKQAKIFGLLVDEVVIITLDVRVDDCDELVA